MKAATHLLNQSPRKVALLAIAPFAGVRVDGRLVEVENIARHCGMSARQSVWRLAVAAIWGLISLSALSQLYAPVARIALDHLALRARGKLQWLLEGGPDR